MFGTIEEAAECLVHRVSLLSVSHVMGYRSIIFYQDNLWLENPSTYSRNDLVGPMTAIGSKLYSFGLSPRDNSILALYELDTGKCL